MRRMDARISSIDGSAALAGPLWFDISFGSLISGLFQRAGRGRRRLSGRNSCRDRENVSYPLTSMAARALERDRFKWGHPEA
jgi:hypothetical protein